MYTLDEVDAIRADANKHLTLPKKSELGQFFTNSPICQFMANLFKDIKGDVKLLDPGCGPGSLSAAFVDEAIERGEIQSLILDAYDIEKELAPSINRSIDILKDRFHQLEINFEAKFGLEDYIIHSLNSSKKYTHCIINPPYKKINSKSP